MQQVHCRGVAQAMECDVLLPQRGTDFAGGGQMLFQKAVYGVRTQSSAAHAWKNDAVLGGACFIEPCFENCSDWFAKRNGALLSSLAEDYDMSARADRNILTFQAGHFGQAQACLQGCQQQGVIPSAIPGAPVRRIQKYVDLRARHEVDQPAVKAFGRHGENALDLSAMGRHLIGGEAEERPNGGEAKIARARGNAPRLLKFVQKRGDERGIDRFECQAIRRRAQLLLREAQQKSERVSIRTDRMRANPLLLHQPLREESLQERWEGRECRFHMEASQ